MAAQRCALRAATCCHNSVVRGRQVVGLFHGHGRATQPIGFRRQTTLCIESLQPPDYVKVPVVSEDPKEVLAEMPELLLSGPRPVAAGQDSEVAPNAAALSRPLDQPLLPAAEVSVTAATSSQSVPQPRFAELSNGTRVVCIDRGGMCASLGLFVEVGSRHEQPDQCFLPHALELMAFRSSAHLSHMRTLKTLEQLGAAASCRVGREDILYQCDTLREYVPVLLPLMLANVLCPSNLPEEVFEAQKHVAEARAMLEENTEGLLAELLHQTAYQGNTLGNRLYADEDNLPHFTAESIQAYVQRECTPDRFIIVGVNTDFDELCKWTVRSFAEHEAHRGATLKTTTVPQSSRPVAPAAYTGGDTRVEAPNPLCHLMLGWEMEGGWNGPTLAAVTVLQMFLGGGGSFSTGGPGKGMHTRMYTEVLNRHHWVESCQASSVMYMDSGIFTVYATVVPQHASEFITVMARIFRGVSQISPVELKRAKNALKSSIHMNLEMRAVMMEDMGRQLVLSKKVGTAQEFGCMVDAVTAQDLLNVLRKCLQTEPTVVAFGAIEKVPSYEEIKTTLAASCPEPPRT
mmetsp:Transcript_124330/g.247894  ORF Transcript_124330/g.247894 Transcript_124330/m.247894 type:complete len:573 (+) Transcript_124330:44-1762(+)